MGVDAPSLVAIVGMAIVTYATRAGGLWAAARVRSTPRIEATLRYVPGTVLTAIVAPAAIQAGVAGVVAVLATAAVALRTGNLLLAGGLGVAIVWALRHVVS